jgi:hypothetical protein
MDELATAPHHWPVRVLPHNKRLDECFGDFLVRVVCECGTSRHIDPEALARIAWRFCDTRRPDASRAMNDNAA